MSLTDIVNKGELLMKKMDNGYIVEYAGYDEYGTIKRRQFSAKSLRLAYLKLEEYLKFSNQAI